MTPPATIDLRKGKTESGEQTAPIDTSRTETLLSWSAPEAAEYKHSREWYLVVSIVAAGFVAFAIILKNYFFAIFIALALVVLFSWTRKKPKYFRFVLTDKGVRIGERESPYSDFTSFWIFEDVPRPYLVLKPRARLKTMLHIPLGDKSPADFRLWLRPHLEETEEQESMSDLLARLLKI